ncbi:hypothetical protein [Gimesia sp.]|uniref:hypothetical protein n=1 Tax=Gimesia sp. TaxID=2024833 RepID=UPI000C4DA104|nr:hypothetical protein [Gimesia sp.]MAX39833.1 hypothetical protein [Gimesia sp.]HAH49307.1 hypothetical protein [Planctomycetaceae bacterium]HBL45873.1 hypothetical protein [Planctomycetaceae bacterium]|tara:strand:+ start:6733 stop:7212 length:480 start_codon:yes stop_codon:yes gene_type:complete
MQFTVAMTTDDVSDIAKKTVDTETDLHLRTVLSCERWILAGGGIKSDPNIGELVGMTIIYSDNSSAILQFEIKSQIQVELLLLSGVDAGLDTTAAQRFREHCTEINASIAHDAFQLLAPLEYVVCNPLRKDLPENMIGEMITLCDHFAAALLNLRGCPV